MVDIYTLGLGVLLGTLLSIGFKGFTQYIAMKDMGVYDIEH